MLWHRGHGIILSGFFGEDLSSPSFEFSAFVLLLFSSSPLFLEPDSRLSDREGVKRLVESLGSVCESLSSYLDS